MKEKGKRFLGALSAFVITLTAIPALDFPAAAEEGTEETIEETAAADVAAEETETQPTTEEVATSGTCGENLTWSFDESTGELSISGTGAMTDWSYSYWWTSSTPWEGLCSTIKKVVIEPKVTSIGNYAFYNCTNLTDIIIPDSVTSIGNYAFSDCTSLTGITIPESVTSIGEAAFCDCTNLIGITIPDGVTAIGDYAFEDCSSLTAVTIPEGVTSIGGSAFEDCGSLTAIVLPDSVTSIGSWAFYGCTGLTEINIPNNVTSLENYAFYYCTSLPSIIIPDGVTSIGNSTFSNCDSLTSVTIPDHVTSIGDYAFAYCDTLTEVVIPESVTLIGGAAFAETPWVEARREENSFVIVNGILIDGKTCAGEVTVPDSIISIAGGAFAGNISLTGIIIPNSVTSIGAQAFENCTSLTDITIPNSVTSIESYVFSGCSGLSHIVIPNSVTSIWDSAFEDCTSLTDITIPNSVTSIGSYAFENCTGLTDIPIPDSVTSIAYGVFYDCTGLVDITIPTSVTLIDGSAFRGCTNLTSVTISNPYCQLYDGEYTISDTATIYGYSNSFAQKYAEQYGREFVVLEGEPAVQYTYEIIPLLSPFNEYFLVKTNNPDPESFQFADKDSAYSDESVIAASSNQFADVKYEDPETLRVNGGYIFYSRTTDGGEVTLQLKTLDDAWMDFDVTVTLPPLLDDVDYLIQTYATESDFFANMDAVQSGFDSICLYSGSYIRGELYQSGTYWSVTANTHVDQSFYIFSPYDREDGKSLFASAIYPYRYDSLGFPSVMASVSKRLDSSSSYAWSETSHYMIEVTYGGETRSYGGAGNGEGQGLSEDKISHFFTFDDSDMEITIENIGQLLDDYANMDMEDDIPREDALTWEKICNTVGDGAWARVSGGFAYLYRADDRNSYSDDEWGVGYSLYWGGSLGYGSDTWVDGRYISSHETFAPGETFEDHPESDIILLDVTLPVLNYDYEYQYNSDTDEHEKVYSNIEISETSKSVRYAYDSTNNIWTADYDAVSYSDYNAIVEMTELGLIDAKYLDTLQLTYDEVVALDVDRNTNSDPMHYYLYNGTAAPGTEVFMGDVNADDSVSILDVIALNNNLLAGGSLTQQGIVNADVNSDGSPTITDSMNILKYVIKLIDTPVIS